jgi:hypothetical protein
MKKIFLNKHSLEAFKLALLDLNFTLPPLQAAADSPCEHFS